ncbi:MAG TPA: tRNA lysidine(34) synthetase TilS [Acidimicrobiales bacterium]|nr:tRNA lysidine(34) synthetase TilS [Acidimicrobiales bacterium]
MSAPALPSRAEPSGASLLDRCTFPPAGSALTCGVSGGADSLVLLALATEAGCRVTAVHVDHGLRPESAAEADVVAAAAARFGARFESVRLELVDGPNLEERARTARHRALGAHAATGHTADDQAETVLANLLRGAGVDGLAGMRAGARHPILALRRWETVALCGQLGLAPVIDPSNQDPRFLRNRVRHELLPLCSSLAGRDLVPVLARQAELLAGDADLLGALSELVDPTDGRALADAPEPVGRRAVRSWLRGEADHPPSSAAVERVLAVARGRAKAAELPGGRRVERSGGRLSLSSGVVPVQSPRDRSRKG